MKSFKTFTLMTALITVPGAFLFAASHAYDDGLTLYKEGRYSEATEAFGKAVKDKDHDSDAKNYVEQIRKETVQRIRDKALTGIPKSNWQSKFYFINTIQNRIQVGVSVQELYEHGTLNMRPGAVEALQQLSNTLQRTDNARIDIQMISEIPLESQPDPELTAQQQAQMFSYLALASADNLPKF